MGDWTEEVRKEAEAECAKLRDQDAKLYNNLSESVVQVVRAADVRPPTHPPSRLCRDPSAAHTRTHTTKKRNPPRVQSLMRDTELPLSDHHKAMFQEVVSGSKVPKLHEVDGYVQVAMNYRLSKLANSKAKDVLGPDAVEEDADLLTHAEDCLRKGEALDALGLFLAFNLTLDNKKLAESAPLSKASDSSPTPPSPAQPMAAGGTSLALLERLRRLRTKIFKACFENFLLCLLRAHKTRFVEVDDDYMDVMPTDAELSYITGLWQLSTSKIEAWRAIKFCLKKQVVQGLPAYKAGFLGYQNPDQAKRRDWCAWRISAEARRITRGDLKKGKMPVEEPASEQDVRKWTSYVLRVVKFHQTLLRCIPEPPPHNTLSELYAAPVTEVTEEYLGSILDFMDKRGREVPCNPRAISVVYKMVCNLTAAMMDATYANIMAPNKSGMPATQYLPNHYVEGLSQYTAYVMSPFVKEAQRICLNTVDYVKLWHERHVENNMAAINPDEEGQPRMADRPRVGFGGAQKHNNAQNRALREYMPLADFESMDQSRMLPASRDTNKTTLNTMKDSEIRLRDRVADAEMGCEYTIIPELSDRELHALANSETESVGMIDSPKRIMERTMKTIMMVNDLAQIMHSLPAACAASLALALLRALEREVLVVDSTLRGNAKQGIRLKRAMLGLASAPALQRCICALILEIQVLDGRSSDGSWLRLSSHGAMQEVEALLARASALQCRLELARQGGLHRLVESGLSILRRGTANSESYEWSSTKTPLDAKFPGSHVRLYRLSLNSILIMMLGTLSRRVCSTVFGEMFERSWRSLCAFYLSLAPSPTRRQRYLADVSFLTATLLSYLPDFMPEESSKLLPDLTRNLTLITRGICMRAGLLMIPVKDLYNLWANRVPPELKDNDGRVDHLTALEEVAPKGVPTLELWSFLPAHFIERRRAPSVVTDVETYDVLTSENSAPSIEALESMKNDRLKMHENLHHDEWEKWNETLQSSAMQFATPVEIAVATSMRRMEVNAYAQKLAEETEAAAQVLPEGEPGLHLPALASVGTSMTFHRDRGDPDGAAPSAGEGDAPATAVRSEDAEAAAPAVAPAADANGNGEVEPEAKPARLMVLPPMHPEDL